MVLAVAGQPLYTHEDLLEAIRTRPGESFAITVEREGKQLVFTVTPEPVKERGAAGEEVVVGKIQAGLAPKAVRFEPYPPLAAAWPGPVRTGPSQSSSCVTRIEA